MRSRLIAILAVAALTLSAAVAVVGTASAATVRHLEGRVVSAARDARTSRRRDGGRGTSPFFVAGSPRSRRVVFPARRPGKHVGAPARRGGGRGRAPRMEAAGARHAEPG